MQHYSSLSLVGTIQSVTPKYDRSGKPYTTYTVVVQKPGLADGIPVVVREYFNGVFFNTHAPKDDEGVDLVPGQTVQIEGGVRSRAWQYNGKLYVSTDVLPRKLVVLETPS